MIRNFPSRLQRLEHNLQGSELLREMSRSPRWSKLCASDAFGAV
jgi:hypothetical protein